MSKFILTKCELNSRARGPIQTYSIIPSADTRPRDQPIGFITNQYGVGYGIHGMFDWRIFTQNGKQIQPWGIHTHKHLDEVITALEKLNEDDFFTRKESKVVVRAVTKLGMSGFLNFDGYASLYFSTYPEPIRSDDYDAMLAQAGGSLDNLMRYNGKPENELLSGALTGDEIAAITFNVI